MNKPLLILAFLTAPVFFQLSCNSPTPATPAPVTIVEIVTATNSPTNTPGGPPTSTPVPPPSVINGYFNASENTPVTLSNSTLNTLVTLDPNGDPLNFIYPGTPGHGTLSLTHMMSTNTLTYTPDAGFYGTDSFAYYVYDQTTGESSSVQTMVITVYMPPVISAIATQSISDGGSPRNLTLSATDPYGNPVAFSVLTQPAYGTAGISGNNCTITPTSSYTGPDSFIFQCTDSVTGAYATEAVTITWTP